MIFEQIYLDCLSQASFFIGAGGRAIVVDPRRDVDAYLDAARRHGLSIEHVVATHVHADFVAGLRDLADQTGATVWMGARFAGDLTCERLADGARIQVGSVVVEALETPGHTPESICLLVTDTEHPETAPRLLTGDTVFIGDVGRPDLVGARGFTAEEMAGMMFDSLRAKILPLDDRVEVWPGHGAGSACGKNIGAETSSTIGAQRMQNWAFRAQSREEFVRQLCANLAPPPPYFAHAAGLNRRGPRLLRERPPVRELADLECTVAAENGAVYLDVRPPAAYARGHVPGSMNVGLAGRFAEWCGRLIDPNRRIVIVAAEESQAAEVALRLARVGLEAIVGWCRLSAERATERLAEIDVDRLHAELERGALQVIDVRGPGEYDAGHVPGAHLAPLDRLPTEPDLLSGLDPARPTAVICASGNRSSIASFFLRHRGYRDLRNVVGGTNAWRAYGYEVERAVAT